MSNFVAYHSVKKWGRYEFGRQLNFYSDKSLAFLRASIGQSVWVVVGTPISGSTAYHLAGMYRPTQIRAKRGGGHRVLGTGKPFKPPPEITRLRWFARLFREQGHFRFGFNPIRDTVVLKNLRQSLKQKSPSRHESSLTAAEFVKALKAVNRTIPELQWQLLLTHYGAPARTISARQLATALGLSKFTAANLHYGKLAKLLCSALGREVGSDDANLSILVTFIPPGERGNKEWLWVLRPQVAKALRQLGHVAVEVETLDPELAALEGAERVALVRHRKREQRLRAAKIDESLWKNGGRLCCEVPGCGFDFLKIYSELGRDFALVHHLKPLGDRAAPSRTLLADLAIVCANCHAMIHRGGVCRPLRGLIPTRR